MGDCFITRRGGGAGGSKVTAIAVENAENLPASAKEGTIAVITDTAVGNVYIQNTEPDSPAVGDVWVNTGVTSQAPIQIGNVTLYPSAAKQYGDGVWAPAIAKVYLNGAWVELISGMLYDSGNEFDAVTGGWSITNKGSKAEDYILVGSSSLTANQSSYATHAKPVDFTDFNTLEVHFTSARSNTSVGYIQVRVYDESEKQVLSANAVSGSATVTDKLVVMDISALEGKYYVRVVANHGSGGETKNVQGQFDLVRCLA